MTPLYIFDLDGTLALTEHRQHLLNNKEDQDRWRKFFEACVQDEPNWPVIYTLTALMKSGADVWVWSGRSAEVMNETLSWLHRFVSQGFGEDAEDIQLCMRPEGDFTPDEQLKAGWLESLNEFDRRRLVAIFDDRQKVVDMWRSKGVACFQVAPGTF
jgi:hypothetical protein